jgi:hypothetical protein
MFNIILRFSFRVFLSANSSGLSVLLSSIKSAKVSLHSSQTSLSSETLPNITSSSFLIFLIGNHKCCHISLDVGSLPNF